jgi:hypothetical protein
MSSVSPGSSYLEYTMPAVGDSVTAGFIPVWKMESLVSASLAACSYRGSPGRTSTYGWGDESTTPPLIPIWYAYSGIWGCLRTAGMLTIQSPRICLARGS